MISLLRPLRRGSVRAAVAGALTATALMISSPAHAATSTYEYSFSGPANHSETATGEPGDTGLCSPVETITFQGKFSVHVAATQPGLSDDEVLVALKRGSLNSLIAANGAGTLDGMSTTTRQAATKPIKVGTWRRDFAGLQERRLEAARMFAHGATQAEVARTFGVSPQAASIWYRRRQGGEPALRGAGRAGRRPRLSQAELETVDQALRKGPEA